MARALAIPLLLSLGFLGGCGQNEGGRCQINSDCASGLVCSDSSGNGKCMSPSATTVADAAAGHDAAPDLKPATGPEAQDLVPVDAAVDLAAVEPDAPVEQASATEAAPALDVAALDAEPLPVDAGGVDGGAG